MMFGVMGLLVTAYIGKSLFARTAPPPPPATRNVPMAVADIPAGTEITADHLGLGPVLVSDLQPDMLINNRVIVGRIAREDLKKAMPLRANMLFEPGQRPPLKVGQGLQAVTVTIATTPDLVDGLIKPNEFCDLHVNIKSVNGYDGLDLGAQATLLRGAHIIAINGSTVQKKVEDASNTVTLELPPNVARMVKFAEADLGTLWISFNPTKGPLMAIDVPEGKTLTMSTMLSALGFTKIVVKNTVPPPPPSVRVYQYRGLEMSQMRFWENGEISYGGYSQYGTSQAVAGQFGGGGYGGAYGGGAVNDAGGATGSGTAVPVNPGTTPQAPAVNDYITPAPAQPQNAPSSNNGPSAQNNPAKSPSNWAPPTQYAPSLRIVPTGRA